MKTYFIIYQNVVIEVYKLGDGKFIEVGQIINFEHTNVFETKFDAHFALVVNKLQKGTPLSNYKSSKYYNEYVARLKKEHPEYVI